MLSLMFMVLFMMPMSLISGCWWLVQNLLLVFTFFMMFKLGNGMSYLSYLFGVDTMSYGMIVLSGWISFLMVLASQSVFKTSYMSEIFMFVLLMLLLLLMMAFSSLDLFGFYLFFEGSLIPILLLILGWGYQPERLQSGIYLLFYTLLASLPLLIGVFFLNFNLNSLIMLLFDNNSGYKMIFYLGMIMAFLVKMPMFMLHLWLPKAHVEAPVSGSMILAGVLLKLGGYGLLRILILFMKVGISMSFIWISISLIGGFLVSLMCLCQIDLKALVAYSSVAHMGIVLSGMMSLTYWGLFGSYTLMIAHGLCSSGLFCLVNIVYDRLGSRSLLINKGLLNLMPSLTLWWFLLCSSNMAAPPSLNLLGEIELLNSIVSWSLLSMVFLMLISFFSASYSLYLFSYSQHGKSFSGSYSFSYCNVREFMLVLMHWVPLNLLILKPDFCVFWL